MTDLVLNATPLFDMLRPRLEGLGLRLSRAIDDFAEARMRRALPARLLQAELERNHADALPPRPNDGRSAGPDRASQR
jgi:hypothetical protein